MSIGTKAELIAQLQEGNLDEEIVWTYWGESDFVQYKDKDQAYNLVETALDTAIGNINEYLESQYEEEKE